MFTKKGLFLVFVLALMMILPLGSAGLGDWFKGAFAQDVQLSPIDLESGLVESWNFSNFLTLNGMSGRVVEVVGNVRVNIDEERGGPVGKFDGDRDYLSFDDNPIILGGEHSFAFWRKSIFNGSTGVIGGVWGNSEGIGTAEGYSNSFDGLFYRDSWDNGKGNVFVPGIWLNDGEWHHYAVVKSERTVRVYRDGDFVDARDLGSDIDRFEVRRIGMSFCNGCGGTLFMNGFLDEVRIYDRALAGGEVEALFLNDGNPSASCTDSDGGKDYYVKGDFYGVERLEDGSLSRFEDGSFDYMSETDYCRSDGSTLVEFSCAGDGGVEVEQVTCENGCFDGACAYTFGEEIELTNEHSFANLNLNGDHMGIRLIGADDVGASFEILDGDDSLTTPVIREGVSKVVEGINFEVIDTWEHEGEYYAKVVLSLQGDSRRICNLEECNIYDGETILNDYLGERFDVSSNIIDDASVELNIDGEKTPLLEQGQSYTTSSGIKATIIDNSVYDSENQRYSVVRFEFIEGPQVCQELIDSVVDPASTLRSSGIVFELDWNETSRSDIWVDGELEDYTRYTAHWDWNSKRDGGDTDTDSDETVYRSVNYEVSVFDNGNVDLDEIFSIYTYWDLCRADEIDDQGVYVCSYDPLNELRDYEDDYGYDRSVRVVWFENNVLVQIRLHQSQPLTDEERDRLRTESLKNLLDDVRNNRNNFVGQHELSVRSPFNEAVENVLGTCNSDLDVEVDENFYLNCNIEPVICPAHGAQREICVDNNDKVVRDNVIECSPGICSGCLIPRHFQFGVEERSLNNVCIPYGTRLGYEADDDEHLREGEGQEDGFMFRVLSDDEVELAIDGGNTYTWSLGERVLFDLSEIGEGNDKIEFVVEEIDFLGPGHEDNKAKLIVSVDVNIYCDIDGEFKWQKERVPGGEWASCQNNYECESNVCSAGQCVEVNDLINQGSVLRTFFVRAVCALGNPFSEDQRNECIAEYLG